MSTTGTPQEEAIYSPALAAQIRTVGARRGTVRVIAVLKPGHAEAKLRELLSEHQMLTGRAPAPGVIELQVPVPTLDGLALHDDVFQWFDAADRLYGEAVTDAAATVALKVYTSQVDEARKTVEAAGGRIAGVSGEGVMLGTAPASKLTALLQGAGIDAIEVTGTI